MPDLDHKLNRPPQFGEATGMARVVTVSSLSGLPAGTFKQMQFTAKISDPYCEWNNGFWNFAVAEGELKVTRVENPEKYFDMSIHGLSALVFCGTISRYSNIHQFLCASDLVLRGLANPDDSTQRILSQMFPPTCPYLLEMF